MQRIGNIEQPLAGAAALPVIECDRDQGSAGSEERAPLGDINWEAVSVIVQQIEEGQRKEHIEELPYSRFGEICRPNRQYAGQQIIDLKQFGNEENWKKHENYEDGRGILLSQMIMEDDSGNA